MNSILEINQLAKSYGLVKALKGVSISIPEGSVYGILGPNGSGKTTMLGILLDVLKADSGNFSWNKYNDHAEARKNIGSLLETPNFYHYMSAYDNLFLTAQVKGKGENEINDVLKKVNLYERRDSKFSTFSLGMKQRLAIASALLGNPSVLVLDEPTNGLDPVGIAEIRDLIRQLNAEGKTILIASHMLDEVEKVCTHVAILKQGTLISEGQVGNVMNDADWIELGSANPKQLLEILTKSNLCKEIKQQQFVQVILKDGVEIESLNQYCFENQITLNHIVKRKRTLESKFIEITK